MATAIWAWRPSPWMWERTVTALMVGLLLAALIIVGWGMPG